MSSFAQLVHLVLMHILTKPSGAFVQTIIAIYQQTPKLHHVDSIDAGGFLCTRSSLHFHHCTDPLIFAVSLTERRISADICPNHLSCYLNTPKIFSLDFHYDLADIWFGILQIYMHL